jgi:2-amino-4-hydroxy-6-hydroxymethyldihydropteridine diphosphokinase
MDDAVRHRAFVGLGANLDDPLTGVDRALHELAGIECTWLKARSSLYRSAPVGHADQPDFINAVAELETCLDPYTLLTRLLDIERAHHRVRTIQNGPRTLDLDLLLYDDAQIATETLTLPHPRMHERAFVLMPLVEIAPEIVVPARGRAADLLVSSDRTGVARIPG